MMDSQIFRKAADRLPALAQIAVLRFNTRGTTSAQGTSEGEFDDGARRAVRRRGRDRVRRVRTSCRTSGWSAGRSAPTWRSCTRNDPGVVGAILLSPPLRFTHRRATSRPGRESGKPLVAIVPEFDDYLRPDEAAQRFAAIPQAEVIARTRTASTCGSVRPRPVLDLIVERLNPAAAPLPQTWDGPMDARGAADPRIRLTRRRSTVAAPGLRSEDLAHQQQDGGGGRDRQQRADDAEQRAADQHGDHGHARRGR